MGTRYLVIIGVVISVILVIGSILLRKRKNSDNDGPPDDVYPLW